MSELPTVASRGRIPLGRGVRVTVQFTEKSGHTGSSSSWRGAGVVPPWIAGSQWSCGCMSNALGAGISRMRPTNSMCRSPSRSHGGLRARQVPAVRRADPDAPEAHAAAATGAETRRFTMTPSRSALLQPERAEDARRGFAPQPTTAMQEAVGWVGYLQLAAPPTPSCEQRNSCGNQQQQDPRLIDRGFRGRCGGIGTRVGHRAM